MDTRSISVNDKILKPMHPATDEFNVCSCEVRIAHVLYALREFDILKVCRI